MRSVDAGEQVKQAKVAAERARNHDIQEGFTDAPQYHESHVCHSPPLLWTIARHLPEFTCSDVMSVRQQEDQPAEWTNHAALNDGV